MPFERDVTLKQLRGYAEVLRRGSIAAAAARLHVTPPAISTQLKALETMAGGPILHRMGDTIRPTETGEEILRAAGLIEAALVRAGARMAALRAGAAGLVRLGVVSTGKYFAPGLVACFQRARPEIALTLTIGNRGAIIEALATRGIDMAVMGRAPEGLEVTAYHLGPHPHVVIAPPDHRLAARAEVEAADLLAETFLAREAGSGTRTLMTRVLDHLGGGRSYTVVEMASNETIKQAVMAGLGIAFLSAHTAHVELAEGKLVALAVPGLPVMRDWYLIQLTEEQPTAAAVVFRDFVVGLEGSFLPRI
ncbi:LysR family transcriptional regulator [Roseospira visakhapatnamensis]|uniref:HTH-type transcriptional regulator CbbR n=1 Tax=Roseospira visakhapatnamensis TaxID=390880 RepID=A0A7W6WBB6_9PROT|nr:LysR family transcriptional regulator [Roseospira visakhapatnamensis]MBB4267392.1 DNA-binding transcriptional LysR family regulator [Roseospira visakhapatnamensis]